MTTPALATDPAPTPALAAPDAKKVRRRRAERRRRDAQCLVERLDERVVLDVGMSMMGPLPPVGVALLDPATQPRFVNPLPNPLDPAFVLKANKDNSYKLGTFQVEQKLGLVDPKTGKPLTTTVWGYGTKADKASYPGPTFVAQRGQPITVTWTNNLVDSKGNPLPHLLPIDQSIHWAFTHDMANMPPGAVMPMYPQDGVPTVTHLHGGFTAASSDGVPDAWTTPNAKLDGKALTGAETGAAFNPVYTYDNNQEAATLWYHDHALGITRLNVYAGLAGFYIVRDQNDTGVRNNPKTAVNENPSGLPVGPYEVPMVIQDRMFTTSGQLYYPSAPPTPDSPSPSVLPEFFGDTILVNGAAWPVLDVEPREYRLRMLNGSDSRFYNMYITIGADTAASVPIYQVGTDAGLLPRPAKLDGNQLRLAPGERADVVIDFSDPRFQNKTLIVRNNAGTPFSDGVPVDAGSAGQIMAFRVSKKLNTKDYPLTSVTKPVTPGGQLPYLRTNTDPLVPLVQQGPTRQLMLGEGMDQLGRLRPMLGTLADGTLLWDDPTTETPLQGDTEVWEIYNGTMDAHPIHLHSTAFQIVNRQTFTATPEFYTMSDGLTEGVRLTNVALSGTPQAPKAWEKGWKDTAVAFPGEVLRVIARFDRVGSYVWHCHILSHEDNEMMRKLDVQARNAAATPVAPMSLAVSSLGALTGTTSPLSPLTSVTDPTLNLAPVTTSSATATTSTTSTSKKKAKG